MSLEQDTIAQQLDLLAANRRRLAVLLRQQARLGDYAPPHVLLEIEDAQAEVRAIKETLSAASVAVEDELNDEIQPAAGAPHAGLNLQERRNRRAMLAKLKSIWIDGLLEQSLAKELRIALDLIEKPDVVDLPLNAFVQELRQPPRALLAGTPIVEVFEKMGGELLILGAPGAGKTTLLLELARYLLDRAISDEGHPIPVMFNLSSWARRQQPFATWLVDELNSVYDVPRKVAQAWITGDALLLLLDGLDEVRPEQREACVAAINTFRRQHGTIELAVCSRIADYTALESRLKLQGAVVIQPLTEQQIDRYLEHAGDRLGALRSALHADPNLRSLADSPLMLSIIALACRDMPSHILPTGDPIEAQRKQIFAAYVNQMFARRSVEMRYTREQTTHWLAWLAREMRRQEQPIFLLDRLQPEWLPSRVARVQYVLLDRLGWELIIVLVIWSVFSLAGGLMLGLVLAVCGGVVVAQPQIGCRSLVANVLLTGLAGGLIGLLVVALVGWFTLITAGLLFGGLFGGLAGALLGRPSLRPRQIVVVERLRWSYRKAWRSALSGLVLGLLFGLSAVLVVGQPILANYDLGFKALVWLMFGLIFGLFFALLFALAGGLDSGTIAATATPNEGIRRSARSALLGALVFGLVFGLVLGASVGMVPNSGDPRFFGLVFGVSSALLGGLAYGGYALLSHLTLRLVLWWNGVMPLRYVRFLDYAAERIFLRKAGGGYIFVHRLLMEHFASLERETTE
jgi:DNA polymerase III delta prime subunit